MFQDPDPFGFKDSTFDSEFGLPTLSIEEHDPTNNVLPMNNIFTNIDPVYITTPSIAEYSSANDQNDQNYQNTINMTSIFLLLFSYK